MTTDAQRLALKIAATAVAFLWAFVSVEHQWGVFVTVIFAAIAVGFGAAAAKDLGRMGR